MTPAGDSASRSPQQLEGLTTAEATELLARHGPNEVRERRESPWLAFARRFWAPVPWMLELAVVLAALLGRWADALIILFLLAFNAVVSYLQERRAENALELLKKRLAISARVLRDGRWQLVPAQELVPGDVAHVRAGDVVPADLELLEGTLLLDQSALTGESLPREANPPQIAYSGATVQQGEATGSVSATGEGTYFGKTAQLVQAAGAATHLESLIFSIVRYLMAFDVLLVIAIVAYAPMVGVPFSDVLPFVLMLLIASVPAALPATFTLAQALGAVEMTHRGILVTRLSSIEEAAMMDVLCTDKTGTITLNQLSLGALQPYPPVTQDQLLDLAALASDASTQDPIDLAILSATQDRGGLVGYQRVSFTPFDPATKRTEAVARRGHEELRIVKGMPEIVARLVGGEAVESLPRDVNALAAQGNRVLAVAVTQHGGLQIAGLIGLMDRPRPDSSELIGELHRLGIQVKMVTGDTAPTALAVARLVGIDEGTCGRPELQPRADANADQCDIFAGVYPQDKYNLVRSLQQARHTVGMTGDGVNDAPALKQAEVGIAVAAATDVAKAAAGMVLTTTGLVDIVDAIQASRRIYQRMLTYTLNKIIKTFQVALFLSLAFFLTRSFVVTPFLIVLLIFANDFVTMSIATDRASYSSKPDRWHVRSLIGAAALLSLGVLAESFLVLYLAVDAFHLPLPQLQTLVFTVLVFSGQATVYLIRVRGHFWTVRPSSSLMIASLADVAVVTILATRGILMAPVPLPEVLVVLGIAALTALLMDPIKVSVFRRFGLG